MKGGSSYGWTRQFPRRESGATTAPRVHAVGEVTMGSIDPRTLGNADVMLDEALDTIWTGVTPSLGVENAERFVIETLQGLRALLGLPEWQRPKKARYRVKPTMQRDVAAQVAKHLEAMLEVTEGDVAGDVPRWAVEQARWAVEQALYDLELAAVEADRRKRIAKR